MLQNAPNIGPILIGYVLGQVSGCGEEPTAIVLYPESRILHPLYLYPYVHYIRGGGQFQVLFLATSDIHHGDTEGTEKWASSETSTREEEEIRNTRLH